MAHKLLLADDSVTIQRVIELTFADEDVQVIAVGDGKHAIERVQAEPPDIVLADVGMPERDGYEVAAFIKGNPQLAHIPVLLLTGAFEPIDESRARSVGCDGVLVKPFEPQMVISRVKDLLSGRRPTGLWAATPAAQTPVRPPAPPVPDIDTPGQTAAPPAVAGATQGNESLDEYFDRLDAAFSVTGPAAMEPAPVTPPSPPPIPVSAAPLIEVAPPAPARSQSGPLDELATWDPELVGDPARPASSVPAPFQEVVGPDGAPWEAQVPEGFGPSQPAAAPAPVAPIPPVAPTPTAPPAFAVAPAVAAAPQVAAPASTLALPPLSEAFAALLAAEQGRPVAPAAFPAVPEETLDEIVRRVIDRMSADTIRRTVVEVAERLVREEIERIKSR
jgi:CheY-like chemotaxis protein